MREHVKVGSISFARRKVVDADVGVGDGVAARNRAVRHILLARSPPRAVSHPVAVYSGLSVYPGDSRKIHVLVGESKRLQRRVDAEYRVVFRVG